MSDTLPKLLQEIHSVETASELNSKISDFESRISSILSASPDQKNYYINHTGRELYRKLYNFGLDNLISYSYDSGFRPNLPHWSPSEISTAAWFDGSDLQTITSSENIVSNLNDKSGNSVNLTVPTENTGPKTGTRTLNDLNVIEWDTADQLLENTSFSHDQANNPLYLAIVFSVDVNGLQDFLFAGTDSVAAGNRMAVRRNVANSSMEIIGGSGTGSNISLRTPVNSCVEGDDYIVLLKLNSATSEIRINGSSEKTGNIGTNTLDTFTIGGNALGSQNIDGYIAELVTFLDPNGEEIEGYLAHKWGLESKLPSSHPYKKVAPFIFDV